MKLRHFVIVLGSLNGAWACGGRTGVGLFDEGGMDGGGQDGAVDSSGDIAVSDVAISDATVCEQNPEMSVCCGFGPPSGGYSCELYFGASVCGPNGWTCPNGGSPAPGCSRLCTGAPDAGLMDAPSCPEEEDSGTQPPSCAPGGPGMTNCGPCDESCCTSLEVVGGTYYRTYTYGDTSSYADPATVSGFRLDKYLVTVGRFRQFVTAWNRGYYPGNGSGIHTHLNSGKGLVDVGGDAGLSYEQGWDAVDWNNVTDIDPTTANLQCGSPYNTWTATAMANENLPIHCVTWFESYAFCIWDGGFLPSEAEWEYAAAGGSQQLEYPWGSTAPGTADQYAIYNLYYKGNATDIAPVGFASLGAGTWGQFDLAGEVDEWNLDWFNTYVDPCTNCANLSTASSGRVVHGGNFGDTTVNLLPPFRSRPPPTYRDGNGFRCARTP